MGKIVIKAAVVGMLQTNCYFVYDDERKEALIVDPGSTSVTIKGAVEHLGIKPIAILLTHGHADHIGALPKVKAAYNIPVYYYELERQVLTSPLYNLAASSYEPAEDDVAVTDGQILELGGMEIKVIHTPGHTPGSCCYYIESAGILLSGDTMFRYSWGRTDFPGGSETDLMRSLRERLLPLPPETMVYPGHEGATQIGDERRMHGYLER